MRSCQEIVVAYYGMKLYVYHEMRGLKQDYVSREVRMAFEFLPEKAWTLSLKSGKLKNEKQKQFLAKGVFRTDTAMDLCQRKAQITTKI
jgi:hypothetical protein